MARDPDKDRAIQNYIDNLTDQQIDQILKEEGREALQRLQRGGGRGGATNDIDNSPGGSGPAS